MKNLSRVFQKQKKRKKKHIKRISFITQFKTEFLILFTGCRKVLGKMPAIQIIKVSDLSHLHYGD